MKINLSSNRTKSMSPERLVTAAVLSYQVSEAPPERYSDEEVLASVLDAAPETIGRARVTHAEISEYFGAGLFEVEVNYEEADAAYSQTLFSSRRERDQRWFLATSHASERTFAAVKTISYGPNPPQVNNLVNWNGKKGAASVVSGADIICSTLRENCVLTVKLQSFNTSLRKKIASLTGCLNNRAFHGWAAGEVLFLGANSGLPYRNDKNEELVDVTLQFAVRKNPPERQINGCNVSCGGWDVLWPLGSNNVFVSKVYPQDDLNMLGVG